MKHWIVSLLIVGIALGLTPGFAWGQSRKKSVWSDQGKWAKHTGDLVFVVGYENGRREAEASGKPMFLFFTTTICKYCKQLAADSFRNPEVLRKLVKFVPVLVDGDRERQVCSKYGVSGFPNLRFETIDGKQHGSIEGYRPVLHVSVAIDKALRSIGKIDYKPPYVKQLVYRVQKAVSEGKIRQALLGIIELEESGVPADDYRKATELKEKLEKLAARRLERAQKLHEVNPDEGRKALEQVQREFIGLAASAAAGRLLE